MARTRHLLDLHELGLRPGDRTERSYLLHIAPVTVGGTPYDVIVGEEGASLSVQRIAGGHLLVISLNAVAYGPCSRCLSDVALPVTAHEEEFIPLRPEEWEEADVSPFVDDHVVDVDGLAREAVVLALPAKVLCDERCPGLCPHCGRPLQFDACECAASTGDERWARLADLFSESDEKE